MPAFNAETAFFKQGEVDNISLGQGGATVETGTTAVTGTFAVIQFLEGGSFAALTSNYDGDTLVGVTMASGTIIYGRFTAFTLSSGKVIAYKY